MTRTQKAMLKILSDGEPHLKSELHKVCGPSSKSVVKAHLYGLRKHLPQDEMIVCIFAMGGIAYQHVKRISPPVPTT